MSDLLRDLRALKRVDVSDWYGIYEDEKGVFYVADAVDAILARYEQSPPAPVYELPTSMKDPDALRRATNPPAPMSGESFGGTAVSNHTAPPVEERWVCKGCGHVLPYGTMLTPRGEPPAHIQNDGTLCGPVVRVGKLISSAPPVERCIEMALCESERLILHPDTPYIFRVIPGCTRCAELARIGTPDTDDASEKAERNYDNGFPDVP